MAGGTLSIAIRLGRSPLRKRRQVAGETLSADGTKTLQDAAHGLAVNQMKLVHVDDTASRLPARQGYVAFQDRCTHKGGPLSDGVLGADGAVPVARIAVRRSVTGMSRRAPRKRTSRPTTAQTQK